MTLPNLQMPSHPEKPLVTDLEVHVWQVWLDDWEGSLLSSSDLLSCEEKLRAASYRLEKDRRRFVSRRILLKKLLSHYLDIAPQMVLLRYNPLGKPHLADSSGSDAMQFNMSHSQGLAIYVFGRHRRLGVDLEALRLLPEVEVLCSRWFPGQQGRLGKTLSEKQLAFYRMWTLSEAYLKALGKGFGSPEEYPDVMPYSLKTDWHDPAVQFYQMGGWSFRLLTPAPHFVAALAVDCDNYLLRCFEWRAQVDSPMPPL